MTLFAQTPPAAEKLQMGFQNIIEAQGLVIAGVGMTIVFVALILISAFITVLPRILQALSGYLPPEAAMHSATPSSRKNDDAVIAAIAWAMHQQTGDSSGNPGAS